jgi:CheY-like chemotaxis protein
MKMGPTSEIVGPATGRVSQAVVRPLPFNLRNQAAKGLGNCTDGMELGSNWVSRLKLAVVLRVVVLAVGLSHSQLDGAPDPYASEFVTPPPEIGSYAWEKSQQAAKERQEQFRIRVAIPDAVGDAAMADFVARRDANQNRNTTRTAASFTPGELFRVSLYFAVIGLTGILALRKLAPDLIAALNQQFNPWALVPATSVNYGMAIRAEDAAFSEFALAFQTGPSASVSSGTPMASSSTATNSGSEFHARAAMLIAAQRKLLEEIVRGTDAAVRHRMLTDLRREMSALKGEAGRPEVLLVWQVASALEGLLKQLTDKMGNVTTSTLRTVAGGVDLLADLCRPGLKTDLLTAQPLRFLAVDDDLISRKAIAMALKKALTQPDLAENGESALALATRQAYDVIFLDVQMPGMDGFELCSRIHATDSNATTPVVFVTVQNDFDAHAQATLSGGSELMGKPFLTFEVTVKALTLALRGRLQGRCLAAPVGVDSREATMLAPALAKTGCDVAVPANLPEGFASKFLTRASAQLASVRDLLQNLTQTSDEVVRQEMLADIYLRIHALNPKTDSATIHPAIQLSGALQGLLRKLLQDPQNATPSTLVTLAAGVELLHDLCDAGLRSDLLTNPPIRMLVVDDDPIARRAVAGALQMAFEKPEAAASGEAALAAATARPFDLIFMDVQMPGMDGFTACAKLHETGLNRTTPVVFVTGRSDFEARAQMSRSGGSDLVSKPFLKSEITVKALTFVLRGRIEKAAAVTN